METTGKQRIRTLIDFLKKEKKVQNDPDFAAFDRVEMREATPEEAAPKT